VHKCNKIKITVASS